MKSISTHKNTVYSQQLKCDSDYDQTSTIYIQKKGYYGYQERIRVRSVQLRFIENQTAPPLRHVMTFINARACMSDVPIDDG